MVLLNQNGSFPSTQAKVLATTVLEAVFHQTQPNQSMLMAGEDSVGGPKAFELDSEGEILKPEILLSDWIELVLLFLLLVLGLPLNIAALCQLLRSSQFGGSAMISNGRNSKQDITRTSFHWLKIHLTLIDLIVICVYCPSHIAWLINYTWNAGGLACRAMQYGWDFCFHLMSFGVMGIGVDRLRTVYGLMRLERTGRAGMCCPYKQLNFVKHLILICYLGAALFSIPQWFVWTTVDFSKWSQCTTVWHKWRALEYVQGVNVTESFEGERIYTLVHLMTVFWIPFLVIFGAYLYIVVYLFYYSLRPYNSGLLHNANPMTRETSTFIPAATTNGVLSERSSVWQNPPTTVPPASTTVVAPRLSMTTVVVSVNGNGTAADVPLMKRIKSRSLSFGRPKNVPAWRVEMRSRIFRTAIYVIAAYLVCWMPYNVLSLVTVFSNDFMVQFSINLEVLRVCVLLNTILNPFIYGFNHGPST